MLTMKYFVLKPRPKNYTDIYAEASRAAMIAYAKVIQEADKALSRQLIEWAEKESLLNHRMKPPNSIND